MIVSATNACKPWMNWLRVKRNTLFPEGEVSWWKVFIIIMKMYTGYSPNSIIFHVDIAAAADAGIVLMGLRESMESEHYIAAIHTIVPLIFSRYGKICVNT